MSIKERLKSLTPPWLMAIYYQALALGSALLFGRPSRRLVVVGVTGTKGKSSTIFLMRAILEEAGFRVGWTSTVSFGDGVRERPNKLHMTMPGRFFIQRQLRAMARHKCDYALLEVTSEGIKQFRHWGVNFDAAVFTNLAPEHLEAHGGLAEYRAAKLQLFKALARGRAKRVTRAGQQWQVAKVSIVNIDSEQALYFLKVPVEHTIGYGILNRAAAGVNELVRAEQLVIEPAGTHFKVRGVDFWLKLPGTFSVYNALAAIALGLTQGVALTQMQAVLAQVKLPAGRLQFIDGGQPFKVVVDYAHTPDSLRAVYETMKANIPAGGRLVGVLGAAGGGRDIWKRPVLGKIAEEFCDEVVVTNEDPYDEDPLKIMHAVVAGVERRDKVRLEPDRRLAIRYALSIAKPRDTVVITGKGSEQTIIIKGRAEPWSDAEVAAAELKALGYRHERAML